MTLYLMVWCTSGLPFPYPVAFGRGGILWNSLQIFFVINMGKFPIVSSSVFPYSFRKFDLKKQKYVSDTKVYKQGNSTDHI